MMRAITIFLTILMMSCFNKADTNSGEILDITLDYENKSDKTEEFVELNEDSDIKEIILDYNILGNEIEFYEIDNRLEDGKKYAVVGNSSAISYKEVVLQNNKDSVKLEKLSNLNIGEIIEIETTIIVENNINDNFFTFNGDKNFFYKTTINEVNCLVWGGDLIVGLNSFDAIKTSNNYQKKNFNDNYLPFNGETVFNSKIKNDISKDFLSIQDINSKKSIQSLYFTDSKIRDNVLFLTTDLFTNTIDTIYSEYITLIEKESIIPELDELLDNIISAIDVELLNSNMGYKELLNSLKNYFNVGKLLIYMDDNSISKLPEAVLKEYNLIVNADSIEISPILKIEHNYLKYKDSSISRALLWFMISNLDSKQSLLLTKLFYDNPDFMNSWNKVNNIVRDVFGEGISQNIESTLSMDDEYIYSIFPSWIENENNISDFFQQKNLIIDNFSFISPPYNIDDITHETTKHITESISLLPFMSKLGSKVSFSILNQLYNNHHFWNNLKSIAKEEIIFDNTTIYSKYFDFLKSLSKFEQSYDFIFTRNSMWNKKSLFTIHGAYVEFKNIKQKMVLEIEDDEKITTTDLSNSIIDYPRPIHYIEPNLEFFTAYHSLLNGFKMAINSEDSQLLKDVNKLLDLNDSIMTIVKKEIDGVTISYDENELISQVPGILKKISNNSPITEESIASDYKLSIKSPKRIFIPLNDKSGKRVSTGYIYSYFENGEQPLWAK